MLDGIRFQMDDQICPRCKTSKFGNPSLKLLVNVCGHPLCDSCVDILFNRGSAHCPECSVPLRRGNFRAQIYEDPYVEKELDIRRKVLKDFNKVESDFASLRDYNDYLEEVETIIFNLANNVDVEATKKRIETYKNKNKDLITRNRLKLSADDKYVNVSNLLNERRSKVGVHGVFQPKIGFYKHFIKFCDRSHT